MSVYTRVGEEELALWLNRYDLGSLLELRGISSGIENTNYFVTTNRGRFVLTLFERLTGAEVPYYLNLMAHLSRHGIPCPAPMADLEQGYVSELNGKPASLLSRLDGQSPGQASPDQCAALGAMLATMHLAGQAYPARMANPRGSRWRAATAEAVMPFLDPASRVLLEDELRFQASRLHDDLPRGVIHADLFRDNVLYEGDDVSGILDFYFACDGAWLYDLAIVANDWCVTADGGLDRDRLTALLRAYHGKRPLLPIEREQWAVKLRAAALRFWLSRLHDKYFPRPGEMTFAKDPDYFRRILQGHVAHHDRLRQDWT